MRTTVRAGCAALLVLLACSSTLHATPQSPQSPPPAPTVQLSWEQMWSTLKVTVKLNVTEYAHVNHEATSGTHSSYVRLVFSTENSVRFLRIHLAGAIKAEETALEVFPDGVQVALTKAVAADWDDGVLMFTEKAIHATYRFPLADGSIHPVQVTEYVDIDAVVRMSLAAHAEAEAATEQQVGEIVQQLESAIANALPECILEDFCVCRGGRVFDGVECVDGTPWAARDTQLVAPAGLPHVDPANPASPEVYVSSPEELLTMPAEDVVALSNAQQLVAEADALWPRQLYAATLQRKRVLVFGASCVHLDALLLARHGAHVTVLDGDEANLRAFRVLLEAAAVDEAYVDLGHHTGAAYLDTLSREYDAVVVLDSFTRGPTELALAEYLALGRRLKVGGRWLQLAPSRARYVHHGRPPLAAGSHGRLPFGAARGVAEPRELSYAPAAWLDWMSGQKLRILLKPLAFDVLLEGPTGDGHWTWMDLVRTQ